MKEIDFSKLIVTLVQPLVQEPSAVTVTERDTERYR